MSHKRWLKEDLESSRHEADKVTEFLDVLTTRSNEDELYDLLLHVKFLRRHSFRYQDRRNVARKKPSKDMPRIEGTIGERGALQLIDIMKKKAQLIRELLQQLEPDSFDGNKKDEEKLFALSTELYLYFLQFLGKLYIGKLLRQPPQPGNGGAAAGGNGIPQLSFAGQQLYNDAALVVDFSPRAQAMWMNDESFEKTESVNADRSDTLTKKCLQNRKASSETPSELKKAVEQLKSTLIERGGSASLRELDEEYMKRFGNIFAWTCQTHFQQRLADVRSNKVFSSAISTEIQSNEWIFRIKSDKSASVDQRKQAQKNKRNTVKKQNEKKDTPQKQAIAPTTMSPPAQAGVEQLRTVLTSLGGSAELKVLETKYKRRFRQTFSMSWREYFHSRNLKELCGHPAFILSFTCYKKDSAWIFGLKPGGGTPVGQTTPSDAPGRLVPSLDKESAFGERIQKALSQIETVRTQKASPVIESKDRNQVKDTGTKKVPQNQVTSPKTSTELVGEGMEQLKSLLESLGGSSSLKNLEMEYKKRFGTVAWMKYFQKNSLTDLRSHPVFISTFTCLQKRRGRIFGLKSTPSQKPKVPKTRAELAQEGVEKLESLLKSLGGTATLTKLSAAFKKRFGMNSVDGCKKYFQREKLEDLRSHPAFTSMFTCRRERDDLIFCVKPKKPQPTMPVKTVRTGPPKTWATVPIHTVETISREYPALSSTSTLEIPVEEDKPKAPNRAKMEARGVDQLKKALAACGGCATTDEWLERFEEMFGVSPVGSWVDEHFGADRPTGLVDLPVFQDTFIEFETEPGVWAYEERSRPSDEEEEQSCGDLKKEKEPSQFLPPQVKPVKPDKRRLKDKAIKKAEKAVAQLKELLEMCGGAAELAKLGKMYGQRFGGDLDEEWMKEHFGCLNLLELSEIPIFRAELVLERDELNTWRCSLLNGKPSRRSGTAAEGEEAPQGHDGTHAETTILAQFVRILLEVGGVASYAALKTALEKRQSVKVTVSQERLEKMRDFGGQMEVLRDGGEVRLSLRLQEHWAEINDRFRQILDYVDGVCTTRRFALIYLRRFGVPLDTKNFGEMISHLQSIVTLSQRGRRTVITMEAPDQKKFEGRSFKVLTNAGGRKSIRNLGKLYEKTHSTSFSQDLREYFGSDAVEEILPTLSNEKMFVLKTERGPELFLKPDSRRFRIPALRSGIFPAKKSDEEIFSLECIYVAEHLEKALSLLGGRGSSRKECSKVIEKKANLACFVRSCPRSLFSYMIRSKAFLKGNIIFPNPSRESTAHRMKEKKPTMRDKLAAERVNRKEEDEREEDEEGEEVNDGEKKERQKTDIIEDPEEQLTNRVGRKIDYISIINKR